MLSLYTLVLLLGAVRATQFQPWDSSSLDKSSFFEQFTAENVSESGWVVSAATKTDGTPYKGQWALEEAYKYPGFAGDKGLVMKSDAAYFAISKILPTALSAEDKDLVVQFEVKYQEEISCAGAYIKLLSGDFNQSEFNEESDYQVRFGPDICGAENKVDLALKKTVNSESVVSVLNNAPLARKNLLSNLYTLVIRPNRDIEIRINGQVAKAANLYESSDVMTPSLEMPAYIQDPAAVKPAEWDDREYVVDEAAQKPSDWDDTFGSMWVPNPEIKKPVGWNDDESLPKFIRDPNAVKPAEWNDEEDGEWVEPFINNPKCIAGCGKWEAPKIVNPDYIGEWVAPSIENPQYKGEWKAPLIKNPAVVTSEVLSQPVTAIGFDLWSMEADILFNNIYVGHSVVEAEKIGNETFVQKLEMERKIYEKTKPEPKHKPSAPPKTFEDYLNADSSNILSDLIGHAQAFFENHFSTTRKFWHEFQVDPAEAIMAHPIRFVITCFFGLLAFVTGVGVLNVCIYLFLTTKEDAEADAAASRARAARIQERLDKKADEELIRKSSTEATSSGRESTSIKSRKVR